MTDAVHTAESREELRRQWREHADAVFDRFFPEGAAPTPTFDHLEQRARNLADDLACWLLERRAGCIPEARPSQPAWCPRCGRAGRPDPAPDDPMPKRVLRSRAGDVELARQRWWCAACRVVFFPPG